MVRDFTRPEDHIIEYLDHLEWKALLGLKRRRFVFRGGIQTLQCVTPVSYQPSLCLSPWQHLHLNLLLLLLQYAHIDFNYVKRVPWNPSACENFHSLSSNLSNCCTLLLSLIRIRFAQYLKETTNFNLPNLEISTSCVHDFQSQLNFLSLQNNLVQHKLVSIDGNASHSENCFKFTILYAAAFGNQYGPESNGAMSCIFGMSLYPQDGGSGGKSHQGLVFGLTGVGVALLIDELEKATDNFSTKNFISRGGFGLVFKGILSNGSVVAVKRILESDFQGDVEFCNEVEIISNLKHWNLVPLRGYCVVDDDDKKFNDRGSQRFLMPNGNLEDHLFLVSEQQKLKKSLTWPQKKSIILDVAKGLAYRCMCSRRCIYRSYWD
ncbi:hypothetical protein Ahy_B05g075080 isoform A [Arachis hypogaea]|uniref:Protein kinase domain-containing protein n=1 Tax=Arachis hypogaea TaxID=3818 RepID=A0A444Z0E7_ARAHY|nr:hypothetical protein Ahy_B05g075080 isoform A [Arachis hypogaea]